MDFEYTPKVQHLRSQVNDFMERRILPAIPQWDQEVAKGHAHPSFIADLKTRARDEGLWNLFLPALKDSEPGQRLTVLCSVRRLLAVDDVLEARDGETAIDER